MQWDKLKRNCLFEAGKGAEYFAKIRAERNKYGKGYKAPWEPKQEQTAQDLKPPKKTLPKPFYVPPKQS